jgi:alpha-tubulin suppressor-like RCC1 family protein
MKWLLILTFIMGCTATEEVQQMKSSKDPGFQKNGNTTLEYTYGSISVIPNYAKIALSGTQQLTVSGGTPPYTYSIENGFGAVSPTGLFVGTAIAGTNIVRIADSEGRVGFANIIVGDPLTLSPGSGTINTLDTLQFTAEGGTPPYTFEVMSGGGSIDGAGLYTAPALPNNVTIRVTDDATITRTATIFVQTNLLLNNTGAFIQANGNITFAAAGGTPPYTYTQYVGSGAIDAATGVYTAGANPETIIIQAEDVAGNQAEVMAFVVTGPNIVGDRFNVLRDESIQYSSTSGTAPFTFSHVSGNGSITPAGLFTAGSDMGDDVIRVEDDNGHFFERTITTFIPTQASIYSGAGCFNRRTGPNTSQLKCYGMSKDGVLGRPTMWNSKPGETGDNMIKPDFGYNKKVIGTAAQIGSINCFVFEDYRVKCLGVGTYRALGDYGSINYGDRHPYRLANAPFVKFPTGVTLSTTIKPFDAISVYDYHGCGIGSDDKLYCWGYNVYGNAGLGPGSYKPVSHVDLGGGRKPLKVQVGAHFTCVLMDDNNMKCWGYNPYGNLGYGDTTNRANTGATLPAVLPIVPIGTTVKDFAMGTYHVCVHLTTDDVKCWGYAAQGNLGYENSNVMGDAPGEIAALPIVNIGTGVKVKKLTAGAYNTCILSTTNQVKCWGQGDSVGLGYGNTSDKGRHASTMGDNLPFIDTGSEAIKDFVMHGQIFCAITISDRARCWGMNRWGGTLSGNFSDDFIGDAPGEMGDNIPYMQLPTGRTIKHLNVSNGFGTVILDNDDVYTFGSNYWGAHAATNNTWGDSMNETGDATPVTDIVGSESVYIKKIQLGGYSYNFGCALLSNDKMKCWGRNSWAHLGLGSGAPAYIGYFYNDMGDNLPYSDYGTRKVLDFELGAYGGCAINDDRKVRCWGRNYYGTFGFGATNSYYADVPGEVGQNRPIADLGTGYQAKHVSLGRWHTCVTMMDGKVRCVGDNAQGQLGYGSTDDIDTAAERGDNLADVDLGTGVTAKKVCSTWYANCAITNTDDIKCWGHSAYGQLGLESDGSYGNRGDVPGEMGDTLPFTNIGTGVKAKDISCGLYHYCVLTDQNDVRCWGQGAYGQLGNMSTANIGDNDGEMGDNLVPMMLGSKKPVLVNAGYYSTCVTLEDNSVKCFGYNNYGQLGYGHAFNHGLDAYTTGDQGPAVNLGSP